MGSDKGLRSLQWVAEEFSKMLFPEKVLVDFHSTRSHSLSLTNNRMVKKLLALEAFKVGSKVWVLTIGVLVVP